MAASVVGQGGGDGVRKASIADEGGAENEEMLEAIHL